MLANNKGFSLSLFSPPRSGFFSFRATIIIEKISYKAWQKRYGKSVGLRAPGMFVELLRRTVASTGGTLVARPHTYNGAEPVVSWVWQEGQKAALSALASVRVWRGSRPT
ncbi:hypothetical protein KSC_090060 [Ktedonobacter sp. SOSP1-52]|nr:hypothetical protein KSC_090060 [Ktedonobacter sp. SOSP1-52]